MKNIDIQYNEQNIYIKKILDKLEYVDDIELTGLVKKLIDERNYLLSIANIDTLTGLNNRRILGSIKQSDAVIMVDIDNFKHINDTYGHDIGDEVIKAVAKTLMNNVRSIDYVCRFGGDEFIVIFNNCPENVIRERTKKILKEITQKINVLGDVITVSIGIVINNENDDISSLIKMADIALFESKNNGKMQINEFRHSKNSLKKLSNC